MESRRMAHIASRVLLYVGTVFLLPAVLAPATTYTIVIEMPDGLRYAAAFALK